MAELTLGFELKVIGFLGGRWSNDFVLTCDHRYFDGVRFGFDGYSLLHVVVSSLLGIEALHLMLCKTEGLLCY